MSKHNNTIITPNRRKFLQLALGGLAASALAGSVCPHPRQPGHLVRHLRPPRHRSKRAAPCPWPGLCAEYKLCPL